MVFELASICLSFYNNFYSSESLLYCKTNVAYCYVLYDLVEIVSPAEPTTFILLYYGSAEKCPSFYLYICMCSTVWLFLM